ncbi:hypothetical protein C8F04DRAFT_190364 [Mycena alexandri]|uniref:H-type lectin domain-containing protein n=1 Tax=Mycena alexandri TaxID=1745969 RepID=A0AAD6SBE6_9AGAR|nr:hypothetical protein C8F04DRAFT_190364 [Mycena alexandri]
MTKSDTKPKGLEAVPLGKETGGRMKYVGNIYYEGALHPGNFDLSPTTFYITIANSGKEVMITEGPSLRFLMVPSDTVAWFRVTGYQRWGKRTGIQNPVRTGGDVRWPRYSVRTFHDGGIVGGEVEPDHDPIFPYRGSTFTVGEYHILVYKSELYGFHNAIGQYRTENKWFTVTAGSTNSVWVPFTPAEMENPIILTTISMIYMEKDSKTVRVNAYADFVSTTDFHVHVDTWATSILYNADVSWLKISNGDPDFRTGVFSCTGGIITSVDFNWSFDDPPEIFIGLTKIDLSANQDQGQNVDTAWRWHMKVSVDKVSRTGFRICVEQPRGTDAMHECKITWVAYPKGKPGVHSGTLQASNLSGSSIHKVAFPHPFKGRPMVLTAFTSFIIPASDHFRLRSEAYVWESGSGMDCVLATWAESTITWAEMSYLVLWPDQ